MTVEFGKNLGEKLGLNEEAQVLVQEAWEQKLSEARDLLAAELREEFAQKFEHDKEIMVESMDKFLTEALRGELEKIAEDRKALAAERVACKDQLKEHMSMINDFVNEVLAKEVKELHEDRKSQKDGVKQLENFVLQQLSEEVAEIREDKKSLMEKRVQLISEGRKELESTKSKFIKRAAKLCNEQIDNVLRSELTQFKDDIKVARENDFGRRIFETYAAEFMSSHLNEASEVNKLQKALEAEKALNEAKDAKIAEAEKLVESANIKAKAANDLLERDRQLGKLLAPLGKEKSQVMTELLESVETKNLEKAFNKYLPTVLNESSTNSVNNKKVVNESTIKTGDRALSAQTEQSQQTAEIAEIVKLAGLKK